MSASVLCLGSQDNSWPRMISAVFEYEAEVVETDIPDRATALDAEKEATNSLRSEGHSLELHQRPKPDE